jgi:hypothetical protein
MPTDPSKTNTETAQQQFQRVLSQPSFEGLKAILNRLSPDQEKHYTAVVGANSYIEMLSRLGYKLTVVRQIHVQDSYQRLGPEGGVKAVLPYYDIPTQSSLPTLVNLNSTVTATPKSAAYFDGLLTNLKKQLTA